MEDMQAIRRLKHGDPGGVETLVARYQVKAVRTAFLITHDEPMAEDVVQDVFLRFCQGIRSFDECRPFEPYLMRSVVNAALKAIQKERKWENCSEEGDPMQFEALLNQTPSVEGQVESNQIKMVIWNALSRLSPRQRAAIVQRYYLGMDEKDMGENLDVASGTVKWLLHAARSRLRALLAHERSIL